MQNTDLNDNWFELTDYVGNEEIDTNYEFVEVKEIKTLERFETDTYIYEADYVHPMGCVGRCNVINVIEKY